MAVYRKLLALCLLAFNINLVFAQEQVLEQTQWGAIFEKHGATGTIVIADQRQLLTVQSHSSLSQLPQFKVFNNKRANKRFSPASTYKVPHTLFLLDAGLIKDEFQVFPWDGVKRGFAPHNQDQTLRSAMRYSALWLYAELGEKLGTEKALSYLKQIHYGNMNSSGDTSAYWVNGKLAITAYEQIGFLQKLYQHNLPFQQAHIRLLKDVMINEAGFNWILRAKTGWTGSLGWWIGWVEWPEGPVYFALNIDTPNKTDDLYKRQAIVKDILRSINALPAG